MCSTTGGRVRFSFLLIHRPFISSFFLLSSFFFLRLLFLSPLTVDERVARRRARRLGLVCERSNSRASPGRDSPSSSSSRTGGITPSGWIRTTPPSLAASWNGRDTTTPDAHTPPVSTRSRPRRSAPARNARVGVRRIRIAMEYAITLVRCTVKKDRHAISRATLRSAPAQNVLPAFVSTTTRTASSAWREGRRHTRFPPVAHCKHDATHWCRHVKKQRVCHWPRRWRGGRRSHRPLRR